MKAKLVAFGEIEVDGQRYDHDVVVAGGTVRARRKGPSKPLRDRYGHTPLSAAEDIPWDCRRLIIGTGADGALPVTDDVIAEARRRGVELVVVPTEDACALLSEARDRDRVAAIMHVTC